MTRLPIQDLLRTSQCRLAARWGILSSTVPNKNSSPLYSCHDAVCGGQWPSCEAVYFLSTLLRILVRLNRSSSCVALCPSSQRRSSNLHFFPLLLNQLPAKGQWCSVVTDVRVWNEALGVGTFLPTHSLPSSLLQLSLHLRRHLRPLRPFQVSPPFSLLVSSPPPLFSILKKKWAAIYNKTGHWENSFNSFAVFTAEVYSHAHSVPNEHLQEMQHLR